MALSRRIRQVVEGGSDGWEIYYRARAMQAEGRNVVMLTIGDHDVPTAADFIDAMAASAHGGNIGYAPVMGAPALRAAIAARVATRTGAAAGPENVVVTPGGQAALFAAMMAALDPGDACLVIEPCYATFPLTVRAASGRVIPVAAPADTGFEPPAALIDAAAAESGARALLINSPNNPTGAVYSAETMAGIAEVCRARDLWLISDELYDGQAYDAPHLSPRALSGMAERTLVVGSLSKSHAMTGWRIGWLCGPEEAVARIGDLAIATTYGVPGFIQDAALHALTHGAVEEERIVERYRRRRDAALKALAGARGVRAQPARGGMYLMLDVRATGMSGEAFASTLLETEGVAVMPGESFGAAGAGHLRVALTVPTAELTDALRRLAAFADARAAEAA
ncbi:MAG: pyridoxal phosphate-dependent aminotransferase [Rhodobacteraceae bacterium]|nr:MAG: pyridoxal phosphate-dependent aminotransferase [Paracoccaceae bacterium]